jgi:hypothetical protein
MEGVAGLIRMAFKQLNIEPSTYGIQVKRINLKTDPFWKVVKCCLTISNKLMKLVYR